MFSRRFGKTFFIITLMVLTAGCSKPPSPGGSGGPQTPDPNSKDPLGVYYRDLDVPYIRDNVRVDFLKGIGGSSAFGEPEADFTDAEKSLIFKALNTLTTDEINKTDIYKLQPQLIPGANVPLVTKTSADHVLYINFTQGKSTRPLNPDLGNQVLAILGFPGRTISPANTVFNEATQDYLFPEVDPALVAPLPTPLPLAPSPVAPLPIQRSLPQHQIVVSPDSPDHYVDLTSRAGHDALAAEHQFVTSGAPQSISAKDQIRPHGDFSVLPIKN